MAIAAPLLCVDCSATAPNLPSPQTPAAPLTPVLMEVELDAFSGRKNPEWTLTPDAAASVNAALSSALPEAPALAIPGHLGYRGFIIRSAGREVRVYRGRIVVTDRGNTQTFFDSARIEALLAAEGTAVSGEP